ncbi:MAG: hypothetical protein IJ766_04875 [Clostridia bacterium]|nr:hypothetical protein [Clostridia bacterium]
MKADKTTKNGKRPASTAATKGYYEFSADYPGERHADGTLFQRVKTVKLTRRQKLLTALAAVLLFVVCFIAASVCVNLSNRPPRESLPADADVEAEYYTVEPFTVQ